MPPTQAAHASVRFADGAPNLKTLINGQPEDIGSAYLQVNGATVASSFNYGTITPFVSASAGTLSLVARDELGYAVGPLKTTALSPAQTLHVNRSGHISKVPRTHVRRAREQRQCAAFVIRGLAGDAASGFRQIPRLEPL